MRFSAIIAGLVFLFNPNINIIDILPDAIGYGLILYGILPISRVEANLSDSACNLRNLMIVELCKIPSLYIYALISDTEMLWILIFSMIFGAFEIFFGVKAVLDLFNGVEYLGNAEVHHGVFAKISMIKRFTLVFTILKPLLAVLPDLSLLSSDQYGEVTIAGIKSLARYRGAFTVFAAVIVLIVGIVWLVMVIRYVNSVKKEEDFVALLNERARRYYSESKTVEFRYYLLALTFLLLAFVFSFELKIEGYSLIPPMISGVFFLIFFLMMKKHYPKEGKTGLFASIGYLIASTASWIQLVIFADRHYSEEIGGFADAIYYRVTADFDVFDELLIANIVVLLAQTAYAIILYSVYRMANSIITTHTGIPDSLVEEKNKTEAMRVRDEVSEQKTKEALRKPLRFFYLFGMLVTLAAAVFPMLQIYFQSFFMIELVLRIAFVMFAYFYISKLRQGVKVKGGLDYD